MGRLLLAALALTWAWQAQAQPFRVALIGDLGYSEQNLEVPHEEQTEGLLAELAGENLSFVIHDGDLGAGSAICTDAGLLHRRRQFDALPHPVFYTPGDNEWTDCGYYADPLARLQRIREIYFAEDRSLGRRTVPLQRQSAVDPAFPGYPENVLWHFGGVTFFTMHIVGSNNNRGQPEHEERDRADIAWMAHAFAAAAEQKSAGVMIVVHTSLFSGRNAGITNALYEALTDQVILFAKPVALVNGDLHTFVIDKPLTEWNGRRLENFTRVQTFGTPDHHWVEAIIDPADPDVFLFRPRLVRGNLYEHPKPIAPPR